MKNTVLEKFKKGEKSLGTFTHLLSATAIEALAYTGLDYVIIDMEHSPVGTEGAAELVRAASGAGLCPFVRVDDISRASILKMLDVGALGLVVPKVETVEQVRELVMHAKFAPLGDRGFCPTRDGGWGSAENFAGGMGGYMNSVNNDTLLLPQCETRGCLEHVEEIAAIPGVDGLFIGPFDLSIAIGKPGQFDDPEFLAAVARVLAACRASGKLAVVYCGAAEKAKAYFAEGFHSATVSLDVSELMAAYKKLVADARG